MSNRTSNFRTAVFIRGLTQSNFDMPFCPKDDSSFDNTLWLITFIETFRKFTRIIWNNIVIYLLYLFLFLSSIGFLFLAAIFWKDNPSWSFGSAECLTASVVILTPLSTATVELGSPNLSGLDTRSVNISPLYDFVTGGSVVSLVRSVISNKELASTLKSSGTLNGLIFFLPFVDFFKSS